MKYGSDIHTLPLNNGAVELIAGKKEAIAII